MKLGAVAKTLVVIEAACVTRQSLSSSFVATSPVVLR